MSLFYFILFFASISFETNNKNKQKTIDVRVEDHKAIVYKQKEIRRYNPKKISNQLTWIDQQIKWS